MSSRMTKSTSTFNKEFDTHDVNIPEKFAKNPCDKVLKHGELIDRPRTGRPPVLSDQQVKECIELFKQGVAREDGMWYGFTSLQHAVTECAGIRRIWEESHVTIDQLWYA